MNTTRETVSPAMKAAADDTCGPYSDIFSADTRDLMGFFVVLRKLLLEVRKKSVLSLFLYLGASDMQLICDIVWCHGLHLLGFI